MKLKVTSRTSAADIRKALNIEPDNGGRNDVLWASKKVFVGTSKANLQKFQAHRPPKPRRKGGVLRDDFRADWVEVAYAEWFVLSYFKSRTEYGSSPHETLQLGLGPMLPPRNFRRSDKNCATDSEKSQSTKPAAGASSSKSERKYSGKDSSSASSQDWWKVVLNE